MDRPSKRPKLEINTDGLRPFVNYRNPQDDPIQLAIQEAAKQLKVEGKDCGERKDDCEPRRRRPGLPRRGSSGVPVLHRPSEGSAVEPALGSVGRNSGASTDRRQLRAPSRVELAFSGDQKNPPEGASVRGDAL